MSKLVSKTRLKQHNLKMFCSYFDLISITHFIQTFLSQLKTILGVDVIVLIKKNSVNMNTK